MNRNDVQLLQSLRGQPALSILLPTHRTHPDNQQDPIRVRNLVSEATNRLLAQYVRREIESLLTRLEALVSDIDYRYTLDGLALFVSHDFSRQFYLPFTLKERVVIGETFATRDLVFAMNRTLRYWVLVLSEQATRLYEGVRDALAEVTEGGFPMNYEGPGATEPMPDRFGTSLSAYMDERHRQFFRSVDAAFSQIAEDDSLPLVLVGIERYQAFFKEVAASAKSVVGAVTGNHDKTPPYELAQLVWPVAREDFAARRRAVLDELGKAIGAGQYAAGIQSVWRTAQMGRGATLLVEQDFHYRARVDASGLVLTPAEDPAAPDVLDDAVDDLIETVLAKGGRVVFVENGALEKHQRAAAILRY